jgi:hypothetical protein
MDRREPENRLISMRNFENQPKRHEFARYQWSFSGAPPIDVFPKGGTGRFSVLPSLLDRIRNIGHFLLLVEQGVATV